MSNGTTVDAAAVTDGAWTLFVADCGDTDAWQAYAAITDAEDGRRGRPCALSPPSGGPDGVDSRSPTVHCSLHMFNELGGGPCG